MLELLSTNKHVVQHFTVTEYHHYIIIVTVSTAGLPTIHLGILRYQLLLVIATASNTVKLCIVIL